MGNSQHGTTYMRVGGDDGSCPWARLWLVPPGCLFLDEGLGFNI